MHPRKSMTVMVLVIFLDLCLAHSHAATPVTCHPAISHVGGNATFNCGLPRTLEGQLTELVNQKSVELGLMADLQSTSSVRRAKALAQLSPIVSIATQYARHHEAAVQRVKEALGLLSQLRLSTEEQEYESLLMRTRYALDQGHPRAAKRDFDVMYRSFCPYGGAVPSACAHGRGTLLTALQALEGNLEKLVELRREVDSLATQTGSR